ncbi:SigB/SigF/SigG family RNA polymerase sigma factor [Lagierella sp.]|uniref:SigB/SigF/SigG family RNA polymerase sigma factor n=1 Tax=Lagierella sp. TaxID=2849657 RepID=UPI00262BDF2D|nr:SigB/SigF/SigG family RNA polymerase sigma factor [Lagierella sp.]
MTMNKNQLKNSDTKELFEEYDKTRDMDIREELIKRHLYIAEILAKKYTNRGIEFDDLMQVASLGLILAIDRFDVSKGFEFSSYVTPTIVGEIKKYFRDKGWVIRVPRRIQEMSKKVNTAKVQLSQNLQKTPTIGDIADYLAVTEEEVIEAIEGSKVYSPSSLEITYDSQNEDKEVNLQDLIGVIDEDYEKVELKDLIDRVMQRLNKLERQIIIERYFEKKTQISIAKSLNISQMSVSRVEKKALEKFREEFEKDGRLDEE